MILKLGTGKEFDIFKIENSFTEIKEGVIIPSLKIAIEISIASLEEIEEAFNKEDALKEITVNANDEFKFTVMNIYNSISSIKILPEAPEYITVSLTHQAGELNG